MGLGHGTGHEVLSLLQGSGWLMRVYPGILLADVGHLKEEGVQPRLSHAGAEGWFVQANRTRRYHDAVQLVLLDILLDLALPGIGTGVETVVG